MIPFWCFYINNNEKSRGFFCGKLWLSCKVLRFLCISVLGVENRYVRKRRWQRAGGTRAHTHTHKSTPVLTLVAATNLLSSPFLRRFSWADTSCGSVLAPVNVNKWAGGRAVWWILRRKMTLTRPTKTCCSWEPSRQHPPSWSPSWLFSSASAARGKSLNTQTVGKILDWWINVQKVAAKTKFYQLCWCPLRLCSSSPPSFMCLCFLRTLPLPSFSPTSVFYPPLCAEWRRWMLMAAGVGSDETMFTGHRGD